MLAEFLSEQGEWTQVMPGARACLFSLCERSFPLPLRGESNSRLEDDYYIAVEQEPSSMAAVFHISPTCNRTGLSKQFFVSIRLCGINSLLAYRNCSQHAGFSPAFPFKNMP